jgi:2-oxoglutarate dehydrogenase E2 component (dihydrolipoamide succinyltransferase)
MSIEVLVPTLPESVADATLISWHKKAGDKVAKNENLVDLETDKVVLEVPAPESGILAEIRKDNGAIVTGGELLALIDAQAVEEPAKGNNNTVEVPAEESKESDRPLSPSVRRLIQEKTIDPSVITGTGKSGRITKTDVLDHLKKQVPSLSENKAQEAEVRPSFKPQARAARGDDKTQG